MPRLNPISVLILLTLFIFLSLLIVPGFNHLQNDPSLAYSQQSVTRDYWPTESWKITTPEEQNMNSTRLNEMYEYIMSKYELDGIVIVRHGNIVFEKYPPSDYNVNSKHNIWSCTKSFTSALVGIAIQEGFIQSIEKKVIDFFPTYTFENLDSRKEQITLRHLLSMTSGIQWDEWTYSYSDPRNSLNQIRQGDPVANLLNLPMAYNPGEEWVYCSGGPLLMSYLLYKVSGQKPLDLANKYLFEPMNISNVGWGKDNNGIHDGQGGLSLTPRDMAKFGYLYLNNGTWEGKQLISPEWVFNSTNTIIELDSLNGYSLHWWTFPDLGVYYASGMAGQRIFVDPEHDLIAVFTANDYDEPIPFLNIFCNHLLPTIMKADDYSSSLSQTTGVGSELTIPILIAALLTGLHRKLKTTGKTGEK